MNRMNCPGRCPVQPGMCGRAAAAIRDERRNRHGRRQHQDQPGRDAGGVDLAAEPEGTDAAEPPRGQHQDGRDGRGRLRHPGSETKFRPFWEEYKNGTEKAIEGLQGVSEFIKQVADAFVDTDDQTAGSIG
ncbi:hypothetical protein ACFVT2_24315 [Streptomyces sp. NPDC058000]|uniref:hypothetical protein n=1 Tax=Streptomyces sp. NPDC058000 TaxID=3346299 RepID=UPI0036F00494